MHQRKLAFLWKEEELEDTQKLKIFTTTWGKTDEKRKETFLKDKAPQDKHRLSTNIKLNLPNLPVFFGCP